MLARCCFITALMPWALSAAAPPAAAQSDEIPWFDNYAEALKEAKRTRKPIFLEFRCEP